MKLITQRSSLLLVGLFLLIISCNKPEDCMNNGEYIAGTCICPNECRGLNCETCPELFEVVVDPIYSILLSAETSLIRKPGTIESNASIRIVDGSLQAIIKVYLTRENSNTPTLIGIWEKDLFEPENNQTILSIESDRYSSVFTKNQNSRNRVSSSAEQDLIEYLEFYQDDGKLFLDVLFNKLSLKLISEN